MSDPRSKAEKSAAKDARQGKYAEATPRHHAGRKRRRAKPFRVMGACIFSGEPMVWHTAHDRAHAQAWIDKVRRSWWPEGKELWIEVDEAK